MINVLYAVQVSNNNGSNWLLRNDACWNICKGIVSAVLERSSDIRFTILVPDIDDVLDVKDYRNEIPTDRVSFIQHRIPITPVDSRFHFNFDELQIKLTGQKFHVMINDENTLTKNWKVFFNRTLGKDVPIITTNYFFDDPKAKKVPENFSYFIRQLEGVICSDRVAFQCESSRKDILRAMNEFTKFTDRDNADILKKSSCWNIGCSYNEISPYFNFKRKNSKPIIYFGNRITETANRYTNWHVYAELIGKLVDKKLDFNAYILNPTHKLTNAQVNEINKLSKNKITFIRNETPFTREDYLKFINNADISVNLFVSETHGGVTHSEAMLSGNITVMPFVNNYARHFNPDLYQFYADVWDGKIRMNSLVEAVSNAITFINTADQKDVEKFRKTISDVAAGQETYESASKRIINDIKLCAKG